MESSRCCSEGEQEVSFVADSWRRLGCIFAGARKSATGGSVPRLSHLLRPFSGTAERGSSLKINALRLLRLRLIVEVPGHRQILRAIAE